MSDNEDLLKLAEEKAKEKAKAKAEQEAKRKAAREKAKAAAGAKEAEQRKREQEANKRNAENRKKAAEKAKADAARQKAQRDAAAKKRDEETKKRNLANAYSEARGRAFAAAEKYNRTGNENDLKVYNNLNTAYQTAANAYKSAYGALPGNEPATAPTVQAPTKPEAQPTVPNPNQPAPNQANVGPSTNAAAGPNRKEWANPVVGAAALTTNDPYIQKIINDAAKAGIDLTVAQAQAQLDAKGTTGGDGTSGGGRSTMRSYTQYSLQQVRSAADNIFQSSIGRAMNDDELRALHKSLNATLKANPTVTISTASSSVTKGGVDERGFIEQQAQTNPEFANYQMGTTYFDAMLKSLSGPVGGGI